MMKTKFTSIPPSLLGVSNVWVTKKFKFKNKPVFFSNFMPEFQKNLLLLKQVS